MILASVGDARCSRVSLIRARFPLAVLSQTTLGRTRCTALTREGSHTFVVLSGWAIWETHALWTGEYFSPFTTYVRVRVTLLLLLCCAVIGRCIVRKRFVKVYLLWFVSSKIYVCFKIVIAGTVGRPIVWLLAAGYLVVFWYNYAAEYVVPYSRPLWGLLVPLNAEMWQCNWGGIFYEILSATLMGVFLEMCFTEVSGVLNVPMCGKKWQVLLCTK